MLLSFYFLLTHPFLLPSGEFFGRLAQDLTGIAERKQRSGIE
jgi:hypothetical protein